MADSPAVRQRRSRLHRRGDHSLCLDTCPADKPEARHEVADAVRLWCTDRDITDGDIELYEVLAVKAAEEVDKAGTPGALRALSDALGRFDRSVQRAYAHQ